MRDFQRPGRSPVYGYRGAAATSHPLATLTAIETLRAGGNAVDAAIAAAAVLCVVEPQATGIGGDCFALYTPKGQEPVIAFNGSGRAPAAAQVDWFRERDIHTISPTSPHAVTIPGAVDGWCQLLADHGTKDLDEILQPAIAYAEQGYPVYPRIAFDWHRQQHRLQRSEYAAAVFLPDGRCPQPGQRHTQPQLAQTLRLIAQQGRDGFYQGPVADDLVSYLRQLGGLHTLEDFADGAGAGEYVTPISTAYRGFDVYECPPNGQGITALLMLNILAGFPLTDFKPLSVERLHLEIEAMRLAYRERDLHVADPAQASIPVAQLLSADYAAALRSQIRLDQALPELPPVQFPTHPDTVYLCVVDEDRNAISFIQSIYHPFGSTLMSPQTGVMLHSRGCGFQLDPSHPNCIAPHKRPLHTIIPGLLTQKGRAIVPFGVMGGDYQPAGQVHLLTNLLDYQLDPQEGLDLARLFYERDTCLVERGIPANIADGLAQLGHRVKPVTAPHGGGQAIWLDWEAGVLMGGSDPRKDGCALAY